MDSPVRQQLKRNDYQRHKLFRKMKRRLKAKKEQEKELAEKELRRKLRMPKYADGKSGYPNLKKLTLWDDTEPLYDRYIKDGLTPEQAMASLQYYYDKHMRNSDSNYEAFYEGELPTVTIEPDYNKQYDVQLITHYPSKEWPIGHSEIVTPGNNRISANFDDESYNFLLNNCSDATILALSLAFGTKLGWHWINTPGTAKSFAEKKLNGKTENNYPTDTYIDSNGYKRDRMKGASITHIPATIKLLLALANFATNLARTGKYADGKPSQQEIDAFSREVAQLNNRAIGDYADYITENGNTYRGIPYIAPDGQMYILPEGQQEAVAIQNPNGVLLKKPTYYSAYHPEDVEQFFNTSGVGLFFNPFRLARTTSDFLSNPSLNGAIDIGHDVLPWSKGGRFLLGAYNLANENGIAKTWDLFNKGEYGRAALSGFGDLFNAAMAAEGGSGIAKLLQRKLTGAGPLSLAEEQAAGSLYKDAAKEPYADIFKKLVKKRASQRMASVGNYTKDPLLDLGLEGNVEHIDEIPSWVMEMFENTVIPRLDSKFINEHGGIEGIKKILNEGGYNVADEAAWRQLYGDNFAGFNYDTTNGIAIRGLYNVKGALPHEVRHRLQRIYLLLKQRVNYRKNYLNDAYGSDFANLNTKLPETDPLHNYTRLMDEAETTNLDSRNYLFDNYADQSLINQGEKLYGAPLTVQNKIIDAATDELVIESVRNANGYGRRYIEWLMHEAKRKAPEITTELFYKFYAPQFRDAMKYVPAFIGASAVGTSAISAPQYGYKNGKASGIHIKPENRGKFTALKKRTGHSTSWFKEHGTPALKKMATFALNAKKWKH